MAREGKRCPNYNHGRTNVPVRFCSMCGQIVNQDIASKLCREEEHAQSRRQRNDYCVHCGEQLIDRR